MQYKEVREVEAQLPESIADDGSIAVAPRPRSGSQTRRRVIRCPDCRGEGRVDRGPWGESGGACQRCSGPDRDRGGRHRWIETFSGDYAQDTLAAIRPRRTPRKAHR